MRVESIRSGALMSDRDHVRNMRRRVDGIRKNMQMRSGDDVRNTRRYDRKSTSGELSSRCLFTSWILLLIPLIFKKSILDFKDLHCSLPTPPLR
jgi:hypothetical protein